MLQFVSDYWPALVFAVAAPVAMALDVRRKIRRDMDLVKRWTTMPTREGTDEERRVALRDARKAFRAVALGGKQEWAIAWLEKHGDLE